MSQAAPLSFAQDLGLAAGWDTWHRGEHAGMEWPEWWGWELEVTPHVKKRMVDRDFNEVGLRQMLEDATDFRTDIVDGRWLIQTRHRSAPWEVIVEPDEQSQLLIVITAYPTR